jgi:hypothetical protein
MVTFVAITVGAALAVLVFSMAVDLNYNRSKDPAINVTPLNVRPLVTQLTIGAATPSVPVTEPNYSIRVADIATDEFDIDGDHTLEFPVGAKFDVRDSSGNDGASPYTVTAVSFGAGVTVIGVAAVADATADGVIVVGDSGILEIDFEVDVDETGAEDRQTAFKVTLTPTLSALGQLSLRAVITPVDGLGVELTSEIKTLAVVHPENMDAFQTAGGRPQQP